MLKKWAAVTLSVSLALSLAACGGQQGASSGSAGSQAGDTQASSGGEVSADEGDVIKIGLISMMTGDNPLNGERMNQGVQMAVDEYNAAGGINGKQIELTIVDDQTLQDMAVTCANKLIGEGVVGIVGPHRSTNAMAVEAVVKQAGPHRRSVLWTMIICSAAGLLTVFSQRRRQPTQKSLAARNWDCSLTMTILEQEQRALSSNTVRTTAWSMWKKDITRETRTLLLRL